MYRNLSDIAEIRFGFHDKPSEAGEVIYLQVRHFNEYAQLVSHADSFINIHSKNEAYLLQDGDILLASKGTRNFAWCYRRSLGATVASSTFFVIRPFQQIFYPEYLAAIFNLPQSQLHFQLLGAGSSIQSISKKELAEFKVPVPSIEVQKKVVHITELHQQELQLSNKLVQNKKELYKAIVTKMIN